MKQIAFVRFDNWYTEYAFDVKEVVDGYEIYYKCISSMEKRQVGKVNLHKVLYIHYESNPV